MNWKGAGDLWKFLYKLFHKNVVDRQFYFNYSVLFLYPWEYLLVDSFIHFGGADQRILIYINLFFVIGLWLCLLNLISVYFICDLF